MRENEMIMGSLQETARRNAADRFLYSDALTMLIAEHRRGFFDVAKASVLSDADFVRMAYYAILGEMPDRDTVANWAGFEQNTEQGGKKENGQPPASVQEQSQESYAMRCRLMTFLSELPDVERKQIRICNQIYRNPEAEAGESGKKSLKKKLVLLGYKAGRLLPLRIKVPLKNMYLKIAMRKK